LNSWVFNLLGHDGWQKKYKHLFLPNGHENERFIDFPRPFRLLWFFSPPRSTQNNPSKTQKLVVDGQSLGSRFEVCTTLILVKGFGTVPSDLLDF